MPTKLFGTDGVRGPANAEPITVNSTLKLIDAAVAVLAAEVSRPVVVVGRDTRASGEMLEAAVAAGLAANGIDVLLAGVIPTPAVAFLTVASNAAFGVVISASHNPFEDNGIKFFTGDGYKLNDSVEVAIEAFYFMPKGRPSRVGKSIGRITRLADASEQYVDFACKSFPPNLSLSGIKIAVDAANGAAFETTPLALATLGATVDLHFAAPDGWNINQECGSTHPETLIRMVKSSGATLGLAHDGDADRLLFCDETGAVLDGDDLLAISAIDLLSRNELKSRTVAATIMSNFGLTRLLEEKGGKVLSTDVGDRQVIDAMVRNGLNLGGEQSGHLIYRDFNTTGDGLIAALQILATVARTKKPLSELRQILQKLPQVQRSIPVREKSPIAGQPTLVDLIAASEKELNGTGRILLRYSGTEPKIRLLLEGPDSSLLKSLADRIETEIVRSLGV